MNNQVPALKESRRTFIKKSGLAIGGVMLGATFSDLHVLAAADDTEALQKEANNGGILTLDPNKTYLLKNSIIIDFKKVKGIRGNNAKIIVLNDLPAFILKGNKKDGSATPFIDGLFIYSEHSVGTGLQIDGSLGLVVEKCHFFGLKRAIELVNNNRNITITHNNLWNCSEYGIYYNHANVRQSIINNNQISYMRNALYFENGDVHNLQITGNHIEAGKVPNHNPESAFRVVCSRSNTQFSQIQIIGNTIEDHFLSEKGLINFSAKSLSQPNAPYIGMIEITGNVFSGATHAIMLKSVSDITICANTFKLISDTFITIHDNGEGYSITGNTFSGRSGTDYGGMVLKMVEGVNGYLRNLIFSNNSCYHLSSNAIEMSKEKGFTINDSIISNNIFSYSTKKEIDTNLNGFIIDMDSVNMSGISFIGNIINAAAFNEHGIRITADLTDDIIVKDNMVRGLTSRNDNTPNYFLTPNSNDCNHH